MDDKEKQFEILPVAEMRQKYYWPNEQPPLLSLSSDKVPVALRCLIPLAERWGISDDTLRLDARRKASSEEIAYLKSVTTRFDDELDDWLAGPMANSQSPTKEYLAFSNMRMAADGC